MNIYLWGLYVSLELFYYSNNVTHFLLSEWNTSLPSSLLSFFFLPYFPTMLSSLLPSCPPLPISSHLPPPRPHFLQCSSYTTPSPNTHTQPSPTISSKNAFFRWLPPLPYQTIAGNPLSVVGKNKKNKTKPRWCEPIIIN